MGSDLVDWMRRSMRDVLPEWNEPAKQTFLIKSGFSRRVAMKSKEKDMSGIVESTRSAVIVLGGAKMGVVMG